MTAYLPQAKLPVLQQINEKCFAYSPEIVKVNAGFQSSLKRILIVTSDGIMAEDIIPGGFLYSSVVAERNGRREQVILESRRSVVTFHSIPRMS
ncbi:MAG: hypothetical protein MZV63_50075 [Marinilabiliales bacterium]|nr:hypothetical protein [Marinilabiliales bacterium]